MENITKKDSAAHRSCSKHLDVMRAYLYLIRHFAETHKTTHCKITHASFKQLIRVDFFQFLHLHPSPLLPCCVSGCLQSGMMARGLRLNPQPRRLYSPSLPHQESCIDCCFSLPSLLMGTLLCEGPLALWGASCDIVLQSAEELAVWAPGCQRLLWGLVLNGATWESIRAPKYPVRMEECGGTAAVWVNNSHMNGLR